MAEKRFLQVIRIKTVFLLRPLGASHVVASVDFILLNWFPIFLNGAAFFVLKLVKLVCKGESVWVAIVAVFALHSAILQKRHDNHIGVHYLLGVVLFPGIGQGCSEVHEFNTETKHVSN